MKIYESSLSITKFREIFREVNKNYSWQYVIESLNDGLFIRDMDRNRLAIIKPAHKPFRDCMKRLIVASDKFFEPSKELMLLEDNETYGYIFHSKQSVLDELVEIELPNVIWSSENVIVTDKMIITTYKDTFNSIIREVPKDVLADKVPRIVFYAAGWGTESGVGVLYMIPNESKSLRAISLILTRDDEPYSAITADGKNSPVVVFNNLSQKDEKEFCDSDLFKELNLVLL